jgi:hypothetical protein
VRQRGSKRVGGLLWWNFHKAGLVLRTCKYAGFSGSLSSYWMTVLLTLTSTKLRTPLSSRLTTKLRHSSSDKMFANAWSQCCFEKIKINVFYLVGVQESVTARDVLAEGCVLAQENLGPAHVQVVAGVVVGVPAVADQQLRAVRGPERQPRAEHARDFDPVGELLGAVGGHHRRQVLPSRVEE